LSKYQYGSDESLTHNLAVEEGEPVYLEGGMYLYPDGSIR
ncbi:hypothetical protein ACLLYI_004897, partial [Salmonella enterica]